MNTRRVMAVVLMAGSTAIMQTQMCSAQCCLTDLFAGLGSCCQTAPPRPVAVAPVMAQPVPVVAPMVAPMVAPVAPPQPVMVPMQQVSYVPETCYKTQYECVPVTCYRPVTEVDPCTGCSSQCMQQETTYVQKAVNVPYTQYRAVYSTKYVQVQPGAAGAPAAVQGATFSPAAMAAPAGAATSPFAAPVQSPAAWGAAGADVPPTLVPQQAAPQQQFAPQQSFQQQIIPQSGAVTPGQTYAQPIPTQSGATLQQQPSSLSPTAPPQLSPAPGPQGATTPTPSLRPIPETTPTTPSAPAQGGHGSFGGQNGNAPSLQGGSTSQQPAQGQQLSPGQQPTQGQRPATLQPSPVPSNTQGLMPVVPGAGPGTSTGAFPRLLEPTGHTTWAAPAASYPTAALPSRLQ